MQKLKALLPGVMYMCKNLNRFCQSCVWLSGRQLSDVKMLKVSADDGRGSIKVSCQFLYEDDFVFTAKSHKHHRYIHFQQVFFFLQKILQN